MVNLSLEVTGGVVFWSCKASNRDLIAELFRIHGLDDCIPPAPTDAAALKSAIVVQHGGKDKTVQAHKKKDSNGYELVRIERDSQKNGYVVDFCAKVADGHVTTFGGLVDRFKLQEEFNRQKHVVTGAEAGAALVAVLARLNAVRLTDRGGVYWIPQESVAKWTELAPAFEKCSVDGESSVHMMTTVMSEHTIRAVKQQLTDEVQSAAGKLIEEIAANNLGDDALQNRKAKAKLLHERVTLYSQILGDALQTLQDVVLVAETAAASAMAVQSSNMEFAGIF